MNSLPEFRLTNLTMSARSPQVLLADNLRIPRDTPEVELLDSKKPLN